MSQQKYTDELKLKQSQLVLVNDPISISEIYQYSNMSNQILKRVNIRSLECFFSFLVKYLQLKQRDYNVHDFSINMCNLYQQFNLTISYQQSSQKVVHQLINQNTQFGQSIEERGERSSLQSGCMELFFDDNQHTLLKIYGEDDIQIVGQIVLANAVSIKKVSERLFLISKQKTNIINLVGNKYFLSSSMRYIKSNQLFINLSISYQKQFTRNKSSLLELYGISNQDIQTYYLQVRYYNIAEYHLMVQFKSIDKMVEYLQNSYEHFKQIISFQQSPNAVKIDFNLQQFNNLHQSLSQRLININQKLGIVSQIKHVSSNAQSYFIKLDINDKYSQLSSLLNDKDVLAIEPHIDYLREELIQIQRNQQHCIFQRMMYQQILIILRKKIQIFKINRQSNEGQKPIRASSQRAKDIRGIKDTYNDGKDSKESEDSKQSKDKYFNIFQYLYPDITYLVESLSQKISLTKTLDLSVCQLDKVLIQYAKSLLSQQSKKPSAIYIKVNNSSNQILENWIKQILQSSKRWIDVFNCLTLNINKSIISPQKSVGLELLEYQMYPDTNCLGCTKFFYCNYGNIISPKKTVEIKLFPFVEKISEYQNQIIEVICKFLNTNGGIILFNCIKSYTRILANGCLLTQKDKEAVQNKLYSFLNKIYPKPQVIKNINLSFVPVAIYPKQQNSQLILEDYKGQAQYKSCQKHIAPNYIQGVYVARIKVVPTNRSLVHVFDNGVQWFLPGMKRILKNKKEEQYQIKHLNRAIKRNFKRDLDQSKAIYLSKTQISPLQHECCTPQGGVKIQGKSIQGNTMQIHQNSHPELAFANVSLIVCKSKYLARLKEKLIRIGIKCEIKTYFTDQQQVKLRAANNTAILFHDCRFDDLIFHLRSTSELQFQGRIIIAIYVTKYLKLQSNMRIQSNNDLLNTTHCWLQGLFPGQSMNFYRYKPEYNREEYYLQTDTRLSTLFMYLLFNSYGIKSSLRNPLHLDKQTPLQKSQKFIKMDVKFQMKQQSKKGISE